MSRQGDADARALANDHSGYDAADARRPLPDRLGDDRDREGRPAGRAVIETDIYPVGILRDMLLALHIARKGSKGTRARNVRLRLRLILTDIKRRLRHGDRRELRTYFNGYLAEHGTCPHNAGRGWTKHAAARRVYRICDRYWDER